MPGSLGYRVPLLDRFLAKVEKHDDDCACCNGCWQWTGMLAHGYGYLWREGKMIRAHRLSYELYVGEPGDLFVMHRCDNPRCVNPDHLLLGTASDNNADMREKGRGSPPPTNFGNGPTGPRKTHCENGHLLPAYEPGARRRCKTCNNNQQKIRRGTAGMCGLR
jgi:hypothetical protein